MRSARASRTGRHQSRELIGAAHAGCFSMALSASLGRAGLTPRRIHTAARVHLRSGFRITRIELETEAKVPGLAPAAFADHAETAKKNCRVSVALAGVQISL